MPENLRQAVAAELGFSETVYVEDRAAGKIRIFTPGLELPFAGHPTVGSAWLLARGGAPPKTLQTRAGELGVREEGSQTYVSARPEWSPKLDYVELDSPAEVRGLDGPPRGSSAAYAWAWIDRDAGTIRARCFIKEAGIDEDEATGSAAIVLCARLDRALTIHQGRGSVLTVAPLGEGRVEVGGSVRLDEVRNHRL